ncbi:SAM-dependent methyltransferase [Planobispora siamensis]|uniref:S-adenosyl methyltransferase n=1 Tax=Planobispora siamensis TaxID=936338 RepID=A0A8J3S8R5_9ACTN|nr:SAM-dependent methyltransferase [Planobispora siamensis]GIH90007.1 hypothetical protein Psi01_06370 [Planobispora siamensis]
MSERNPYGLDVNTANVARIYDYMLGGKDNFAADRTAAEQILRAFPESREGVQLNREYLGNAVHHLAAQQGVRQFVDIGAGLPTQQNVHQVARKVDPEIRTVYVDNDPIVCVHGRALLANTPTVAMVEADLRDPEDIWAKAKETGLLDPEEPVAVLLVALLHFLDDPYPEVAKLREMMAPGSFLVITHLSMAERRAKDTDKMKDVYARAGSGVVPRTPEEIRLFFGDFELLDNDTFIAPNALERMAILGWGGVGRKKS